MRQKKINDGRFNLYLYFVIIGCIVLGCQSPSVKHDHTAKDSGSFSMLKDTDSVALDTMATKIAAGDNSIYIIPGKSIGRFILKQELDDAAFAVLGRADSADVAMCKSWSMWYWADKRRELDLYAVCDPDLDMRKSLKVVRLKGVDFVIEEENREVANKINYHSRLTDLKDAFPNGSVIQNSVNSVRTLYEDQQSGIAFELSADSTVSSVLVFPRGERLAEQYLPL